MCFAPRTFGAGRTTPLESSNKKFSKPYFTYACFLAGLWAFHKTHHSHHNPSALAGYAISPMYGFATFLPVYLFVFPWLGLYPAIHWPVLVFYFLLNHYLHCGYIVPMIEVRHF